MDILHNVFSNLTRRVLPWLTIIRVGNAIALGYAAIVGYLLGVPKPLNILIMLKLFVSAFIIGGSSNIINDYYDLPIDLINKPWRPIPSGLIKAKVAYNVAMGMAIIGIAISVLVSFVNGLIALLAFVLSYLYSKTLKKVFIVNNIIIATLTSLVIIYGGAASELGAHVAIATLFAFLLNLGREFMKGIEDVEGDRMYNIRTLATVMGVRPAYFISSTILLTLIGLSLLPYVILGYSVYYLAIVLIGVDTVILMAMIKAASLRPADALKASRMLKIAVFSGITAFLFEAINILSKLNSLS